MLDVILRTSQRLADGVSQFCFESASDALLPGIAPGSHICLVLPNGMRPCYSLVDPPSMAPQRRYTIAVRLNHGSEGASRYLCDVAKVGDAFQILPPVDRFPLVEHAAQHILIAGGIGITPLWSMIQRLEQLTANWQLFYACSRRVSAPFLAELQALNRSPHATEFDTQAEKSVRVVCAFSDEGGRLDIPRIIADAPATAHLYCCGPAPMLQSFRDASVGRPAGSVHWEQFNALDSVPAMTLAAAGGADQAGALPDRATGDGGFDVTLARSGQTLRVAAGRTILDVLLEAGVRADYGCRQGNCGACETRVLDGVPDHRDWVLSDEERVTNNTMMICCSRSGSPSLVLDL